VDDLVLSDGAAVMVATYGVPWVLDPTSTETIRKGAYAATKSGTGRWVRQEVVNPKWLTPSTWYIDPVGGDDENSGIIIAAPLKTLDELARRWADGTTWGASVIISAGYVDSWWFRLVFRVKLASGGFIGFYGTRTELYSGQITSYVPQSATRPGQLEDASVGSFSPYRGDRIFVGTSGSIIGRTAWSAGQGSGGSTTADMTFWVNSTGTNGVQPTGGETYKIFDQTYIGPTIVFENLGADFDRSVEFADCRFQQKQQSNCAPGSSASDYSANGAMIAYRRCCFEDDLELTGTGTIDLSSCSFFGASLFVTGPRVDLAGVLMTENEAAYIDGGSRLSISVPCVAQDWHWWVSQGQFRLDANLMQPDALLLRQHSIDRDPERGTARFWHRCRRHVVRQRHHRRIDRHGHGGGADLLSADNDAGRAVHHHERRDRLGHERHDAHVCLHPGGWLLAAE
jgi:hypothetical protein